MRGSRSLLRALCQNPTALQSDRTQSCRPASRRRSCPRRRVSRPQPHKTKTKVVSPVHRDIDQPQCLLIRSPFDRFGQEYTPSTCTKHRKPLCSKNMSLVMPTQWDLREWLKHTDSPNRFTTSNISKSTRSFPITVLSPPGMTSPCTPTSSCRGPIQQACTSSLRHEK